MSYRLLLQKHPGKKTGDLIRRFNEFKKPIFRDEPPKPQYPLTDLVIDSIFDDTFFTPPHSLLRTFQNQILYHL